MLRQLLTALSILMFVNVHAQYFEGELVYNVDVKLSVSLTKMAISKENLANTLERQGQLLGEQHIWYNAGGFYKEQFNDNDNRYTIYRPDSNELFYFTDDKTIVKVRDASVPSMEYNGTPAPVWEWKDTNVVINGKDCKVLLKTTGRTITTYYYSEGFLPLDVNVYKGHAYADLNAYIEKAGYLPLRMEIDVSGMMVLEHTLLTVTPSKLDQSMFDIPTLELTKPAQTLNGYNNEKGIMYKGIPKSDRKKKRKAK